MAAAIRTKAWMELEEEAERFSLWKIKVDFFFLENQLCSSIKVEKRGGFVPRKKKKTERGYCKTTLSNAKRRQGSRREKRFSGSLFLLGEVL